MARMVALLRGINLGPNRRIPMAEVRALMEELGYEDVSTLLASGNVLFSGSKARAREKIERGLQRRFDMAIDVVLRTEKEIDALVAADPFAAERDNPARHFVTFLDAAADADAVAKLEAEDFAPDLLALTDREVHAWCPDGLMESRLMKAVGKAKLSGTMTNRNWATVLKIHAKL
jgi:uncharacterized protein (DUF1697 family)